ncbi:hypothetical protein [Pseudarthrobacter sp. TAF60_1]
MLSGEISVGKYPIETVKTITRAAVEIADQGSPSGSSPRSLVY